MIERDSAAIQTIQHELFASPIHIREISYTFPAPPSGAERYAEIFGVAPVFGAPECAVGVRGQLADQPCRVQQELGQYQAT